MIIILAIFLFNFYSFIFASVSSNSEHLKQQNSLNNLNGGKINGERNGGGVCLGFTDVFIAFVLVCLNLSEEILRKTKKIIKTGYPTRL